MFNNSYVRGQHEYKDTKKNEKAKRNDGVVMGFYGDER